MNKKVQYIDWGLTDYQEAWNKQEVIFNQTVAIKTQNRINNTANETPNTLVFCEHPNVYTLGKSGHPENLLLDEEGLEEKHASYYKINRGGDITYHGPGQLVGYPILDLDNFFTDIHLYLRTLEEAIILTLKDYGIAAGRYPGFTGVWLDADNAKARKICAMGVRCSRWVTMHGFALNVNANLSYFKNIVPCGIDDKDVTSMQRELGHELDMEEVKMKLRGHLGDLFQMEFAAAYLALGDSYTIGEAVAQQESFPYQLTTQLQDKELTVSAPQIIAKTGWTTGELLEAIKASGLKQTFDFVTLLIGVNNQYRKDSAEVYRTEFKELLQIAVDFAGGNKDHVFVISIPDWGATPFGLNSGRDLQEITKEIEEFNAINKTETEALGLSYTDITPGSKLAAIDSRLVASDGLHPSGKMYQEWAAAVLPKISAILK